MKKKITLSNRDTPEGVADAFAEALKELGISVSIIRRLGGPSEYTIEKPSFWGIGGDKINIPADIDTSREPQTGVSWGGTESDQPRSSWECDPNVIALEALTKALKWVTEARTINYFGEDGFDPTETIERAIARVAATIGASCCQIERNP